MTIVTEVSKEGARGWVRVWDPVVRVLHWLLVTGVAATFLTQEDKFVHEPAGYAVLGLLLARIVWGFIGPTHARFADFVKGPTTVVRYLRDVAGSRACRYLGHNPAGGAMIVALILVASLTGVTGWLRETDRFFGVGWVENLHSIGADLLLALIVLHILGVAVSSILHRENLVASMLTGRKRH